MTMRHSNQKRSDIGLDNLSHQDKIIIVTGGAQGIGKVMTLHFLKQGAFVAALDKDKTALLELSAEAKSPARLLGIMCDVASEKAVVSALGRVKTTFGGLDCLVNNAAIGIGKPVARLTLKEWNRVIGVNLTGPFLMTKYALPLFRQGQGAIVNLCSTRAFMSEPDTEAYSASKGGVYALTHALAVSLGPAIRVNSISPGWIETRAYQKKSQAKVPVLSKADKAQHPAGRVGTPADVVELASYLLSEKAGFVTGQNFFVDGGMTKKMIYV